VLFIVIGAAAYLVIAEPFTPDRNQVVYSELEQDIRMHISVGDPRMQVAARLTSRGSKFNPSDKVYKAWIATRGGFLTKVQMIITVTFDQEDNVSDLDIRQLNMGL
jgi:hypothetical protein